MGSVSLFALLGRLIVAMVVVIALMALAARFLKARGIGGVGPARGQATAPIEVVARRGLGRNVSIAVVRTAGKALVLGMTESSVRVLAEADPNSIETIDGSETNRTVSPGGGSRPGWTWKAMLEAMRELTVRR